MEFLSILGANIQNHRKALGLTQKELAEKVGLHYLTISRIEQGRMMPSAPRLQAISDVLSIEPARLFGAGALPSGERGKLITDIHAILSGMNSRQLATAKRQLQALVGQ